MEFAVELIVLPTAMSKLWMERIENIPPLSVHGTGPRPQLSLSGEVVGVRLHWTDVVAAVPLLASTEKKVLKAHFAAAFGVAISPDDRWLASAGHDDQLKLWDLKTGEVVWTWKRE